MSDGEPLLAGKFTACYGIKGWLRVHPFTESPETFLEFSEWQVERRKGVLEPLAIDQGKRHGKGLVVHVEGVDDRTAAESLVGLQVFVTHDLLPALQDGDYYWSDLVGLSVWCKADDADEAGVGQSRVLLGTVDHLIETGANDVLVVKSNVESIDDQERLIPYLPGQTVEKVDLHEKRIEVDWFLDED